MKDLSRYRLWYGRDEAPAEELALCAGRLAVRFDGRDLRHLKTGDLELLRRLYAAVRDHNWNTIPGETTNLTREIASDHFAIRFEARHRERAVDFSWRGEIIGTADGTITYTMDGVANRAFRYNRIGLCVLHPPATAAGRPYRGTTPGGPISGELPLLIGPQVVVDGTYPGGLFPAVSSLTIDAAEGISVRFDFEGDLFEMEDQRNWTDASFKTYCTPLALPWPKEAQPGLRIHQRVTISVAPAPSRSAPRRPPLWEPRPRGDLVSLAIAPAPSRSRLPAIGFGIATHGQALSARETDLLRRLRPAHLRVDLLAKDPAMESLLHQARQQAAALGCGLELAVFLGAAEQDLHSIAGLLVEQDSVVRVLVFDEAKEATPEGLVALARRRLRTVVPRAQFAGGTNASFCELNRNRQGIEEMEAVVYAITPQIHAFDDTSLVETPRSQYETVRTAQSFCGERAVVVSPVTLKPRFNAVATGPEDQPGPGGLPPQVDPRQMSLLGAGWTAASIGSLTSGGAASITYYETTGWRGVMESELTAEQSDLFPSESGMVFPMYHVFADLAEWAEGKPVEIEATDPLAIQGLAVRDGRGLHLLLANLTPARRQAVVAPIRGRRVRLRRLNEESARAAMFEPDTFRSSSQPGSLDGCELALQMMPFEVVRLDIEP